MENMVLHDRDNHRFYLEIDDEVAFLQYAVLSEGELDFNKTFVPEALRGRRLAEKLMKAALNYARSNGFMIRPSCSYVSKYFDRNPADSSLMVS